ncbi:hypothetical protein AALP_AAs74096U000500 [Arabis alpina]|uniref:Uncharacterized protein n=1 Tax=Arabis alpina TaxID=50452 RepID=A0A087G1K4_ARAAL|nr:hypothetical protein AALP_AAs74096U000500 [Arabis alpina]
MILVLPALIRFLPTIWRCEGRVQGFEMGDGRVHFRFQREEDLQGVLDHRPYHYDGSMIALERWVPTVRRDFPTTIPFWIIIRGLPDYRREEETVQSIGEDHGEYHEVDVSEPIPKVRVTLDYNAPLIFRRETDDAGTLCVRDLQYEKLQRYCTHCLRLTHESPACPERPRESQPLRETRREPPHRREVEVVRGRQRSHREERKGKTAASPRPSRTKMGRDETVVASSSVSKPVRRDLLAELDASRAFETAPPTGKSSTKEWVRRTFVQDLTPRVPLQDSDAGASRGMQPETKRVKTRAPWYRATEEEAAIANARFFQPEKGETVATSESQMNQVGTSEEKVDRSVARVSCEGQ